MDAFGIRGIYIVLHFVTANTELIGTGNRHRPVESAHVRDARNEKKDGDDTSCDGAPVSDHTPVSREK